MERLTTRNEADAAYYYLKCFEKCDGLGASEKCNNCDLVHDACEKLGEYEDLEEQDLLPKLPCKVGDKVYILAGRHGTFYEKDICDGFYIGRDGELQVKVQNNKGNHGTYGVIGKTVFLTQAEAEQKLKEVKL